ncbi:MAG: molybdopterin-guanine dinucleotide biosynthesis protein B [bacterium]|nr:molybdopterin-guanine dinucleotide biosynthesis protein B [bacterium]
MKSAVLDKIASVTLNCRLPREVKLGDEFPCQEGDVVAVRVLTRKSTYNQLELTTGRFSLVKRGDVIAGALGHRRALLGYAGHLPEQLRVGDVIHLLNTGGCLGVCTSSNPDIGPPFDCEVLGQILHFPYLGERIGVPANIGQGAEPMSDRLDVGAVPVVAVVGTCMSSGKTLACTSLIQELVRERLKVHAAKATGVSLRRDVHAMEDAGAKETMIFTDLGVVTTQRANAPALTRSMLSALAASDPDVIVLELGDGLMGDYGVDAILEAADIREAFSAVVLAANDPVGAWGGHRQLAERFEIDTTVVTGPATDNVAGTDLIAGRMGVPAFNARTRPSELARHILKHIRQEEVADAVTS